MKILIVLALCILVTIVYFGCFSFFDYLNKKFEKKEPENDLISINDAIDKVITDFPNSHRVQIINNLPEKYHYHYWINCFYEDYLFKGTNYSEDIKWHIDINKALKPIDWFYIKVQYIDALIEKIKKEEEELKKIYRDLELDYNRMLSMQQAHPNDYGSNKDDGKTVVLENEFRCGLVVNDLLKSKRKKKK